MLARIGLGDLWTPTGPTPKAVVLFEADGGPLSSGERIMLLAAFAFWNGEGSLLLVDVIGLVDGIERLDVKHVDALSSLLIAHKYGAEAVDTWLATYE